jgi:cellulose synthase operon protein YhjQ
MDLNEPERVDEELHAETPEDVAVLYSWAKLQGAKYRDFSASRREYRAQMRHRAAETQRESERRAQIEAETAASATERAAREAEDAARRHESAARLAAGSAKPDESKVEEAASARAMQTAGELARRAQAERVEAARRAEAVAAAEAAARREEREMAEARASAQRQAQQYEESDARRRIVGGPQPTAVGGQMSDPYSVETSTGKPDRVYHQPLVPEDDMQPGRYRQPSRDHRGVAEGARGEQDVAAWDASEAYAAQVATRVNSGVMRIPPGYRPEPMSERPALEPRGEGGEVHVERRSKQRPDFRSVAGADAPMVEGAEQPVPAWIYSQTPEPRVKRAAQGMSPAEDTLQHSRERVASRWFALKGVFDHSHEVQQEVLPQRTMRVPLLTVFSMAGGVGKTSLIATLGRALSSAGERVLLTDTTSHGLLPYYFGASELRAGAVRTFSPPAGSPDAPIYLVSYDLIHKTGDAGTLEWLDEELTMNSRGMQRVLVDLGAGPAWIARKLARMDSTILVPVAPDMNSVISLQGLEKLFAGMTDGEGQPVRPFFVLNQFDASMPLHLDVREVMRKQLGDRLLPFTIRRSPSVSEALAEGMTVMDYAPDSPVSADYLNLVSWLRTQSAPAATGLRNARWSER